MVREAQVGQEGIGKADPIQVCYGGPRRAVLLLAEPQQLLTVLEDLFYGPALFICLHQPSGRELQIS